MPNSPRKRLTMARIAEELGVSRYTVSSVVNGKARERGISQATVERVRTHLDERGYVPSRRARDLRSLPHNVVGVLHCGHLYSHVTEAFNLIVDSFTESPQRLEIMVVPPTELEAGVRELLARGVSQIVWLLNRPLGLDRPKPALYSYLSRARVVIYNYYFDYEGPTDRLVEQGYHLVGVDRMTGFRRLGRLMKRLGHSRVALPGADASSKRKDVRERAFEQVGLSVVRTGRGRGGSAHPGRAMAGGVARAVESHGVTAACFYDDEDAAFAMGEFARRGIRVPRDLSVTGFDGMPFADALTPPLTTLRVPVAAMAERVCEILSAAEAEAVHSLKPELVRGESLGPAPGTG